MHLSFSINSHRQTIDSIIQRIQRNIIRIFSGKPVSYTHLDVYKRQEFKFTRHRAALFVTGGCIFLGILCSLSLGVTKGITIFGLGMFDLFDFVTAKIMLPLGGLCISIFTGWYLDKKIVWSEITNDGTLKVPVYKLIIFILKYIAPIAISCIFINELGLLK